MGNHGAVLYHRLCAGSADLQSRESPMVDLGSDRYGSVAFTEKRQDRGGAPRTAFFYLPAAISVFENVRKG